MERIIWVPRSKWKDDDDDVDKLIISIDLRYGLESYDPRYG